MSHDYTSITNNNNGLPFPDTKAIDASGPTATDGTELLKEVTDDVWLEKQAELDFYNFPPNGLDDLPGVDGLGLPYSQPLLAQYMNYAAPGAVVPWFGNREPAELSLLTGCDIRILLLSGQGILRNDYKLLDYICYNGDGFNNAASAFYHANNGDGTGRNITGDYLIMPDLRGRTLRGWDTSGLIDPDGAFRVMGGPQEDTLQNITGEFEMVGIRGAALGNIYEKPAGAFGLIEGGGITVRNPADETAPSGINDLATFDASNSPGARTSVESRMKNIVVKFGIYY